MGFFHKSLTTALKKVKTEDDFKGAASIVNKHMFGREMVLIKKLIPELNKKIGSYIANLAKYAQLHKSCSNDAIRSREKQNLLKFLTAAKADIVEVEKIVLKIYNEAKLEE